ncbi:MAG: aminoacyl--tRNA ligase-related protein [bacterium]|nr:aminoacyl--tRNA ligase-related protein [bacterium]
MKQSELFTKILREAPKDEQSINSQLLIRGGFIYKNSAGIYSFLPLGLRVIQKIGLIIREEMNAIGGQEMFMTALHDKHYLQATGRWGVDVIFKVAEGKKEPAFNLSWTHEEIAAEIAAKYINSYKDLPFSVYQIQTKFRNEPRAKSGLLRGREFLMKDLYSFHASEEDLFKYYNLVAESYKKIFKRCGLDSVYTLAAGGDFTLNNTHEFQVLCDAGEDTIYVCEKCGYSENKEITKLQDGAECPKCGGLVKEKKSIEVGNIFPLGTKYSEAFNLKFSDEKGGKKYVVMGSYGIGLGRVMATIVEKFYDEQGIIWPKEVAPFQIHLVRIGDDPKVVKVAEKIYEDGQKQGAEVLYDDRDKSAGEKFAEADLIGIPTRIVVSERTLEKDSVEVKERNKKEAKLVKIKEIHVR